MAKLVKYQALALLAGLQLNAAVDGSAPSITARTFAVSTVTRSQSNRVYLFKDTEFASPPLGKVLLLKKESEPVMAFIVLKNYPETSQFAGRRVKSYGEHNALDAGSNYSALEKTGEVTAAAPIPQDTADLKEIETANGLETPPDALAGAPPPIPPEGEAASIAQSDAVTPPSEIPTAPITDTPPETTVKSNELPEVPPPVDDLAKAETSTEIPPIPEAGPPLSESSTDVPPPLEDQQAINEALPDLGSDIAGPPISTPERPSSFALREEDYDDSTLGISIDEVDNYSAHNQWLTGSMGMFRNFASDGENVTSFAGGGVKYGIRLGQQLLMTGRKAQDAINIEAGMAYYKILSYELDTDGFTVLPLTGLLRYDIFFGPNFGIFVYGGIVKNYAKAISPDSTEESLVILNSAFTTAGAGLLFQLGPNWFTRIDMGTDFAGAGLMLSF